MGRFLRGSIRKPDIAIDLGTAITRVSSEKRKLLEVPSKLDGRAVLRSGVITDRGAAIALLTPLIAKVRRFGLVRPEALVCAPSDATEEELDALKECIFNSGASNVAVVPEPLAAAIGAGADVASPYASMICDIGEGITDCAVIKSGKIIEKHAVRVGCFDVRSKLLEMLPHTEKIHISEEEAERIIREVGVARKNGSEKILEISACLSMTGESAVVAVHSEVIWVTVEPIVNKIVNVAHSLLKAASPAMECEVIESGIWLSGGGALLKGMKERLESATQIMINVADSPLNAVVRGAYRMLPIVSILNKYKD